MKFNFSFIWFQPSVSSCLGRAVRAPANRTHLLLGCQAGQSAARLSLCSHHSSHSSFGSHRTSSYWQVFQKMWTSGDKSAAQIVKDLDLGLVKDTARLRSICQKVVDAHPNEVRGQPSIMCFKWLVQFVFRFFKKSVSPVPRCRFRPSETETRKYWTNWWARFRGRPKVKLIQFWSEPSWRRRRREGGNIWTWIHRNWDDVLMSMKLLKTMTPSSLKKLPSRLWWGEKPHPGSQGSNEWAPSCGNPWE